MPHDAWMNPLTRRQKALVLVTSIARVAGGLVMIFVGLMLVPDHRAHGPFLPALVVVVGVSAYLWFFRGQIRRVRRSPYPYIVASEALILVAAMFLALFAALYVVIENTHAGSFTEPLDHFTAYYYALTVLATVGFGDITPVTVAARTASMMQMAIDIVFVAVVLKVLTGAAARARRAHAAGQQESSA